MTKNQLLDIDFEARLFVLASCKRAEEKDINPSAFLMALAGYCVQKLETDAREGLALHFCKFLVKNIETHGCSEGPFRDKLKSTH